MEENLQNERKTFANYTPNKSKCQKCKSDSFDAKAKADQQANKAPDSPILKLDKRNTKSEADIASR